ncbi:hypothetical protein [Flavobacterium hungaricum]|uniref:DUF4252 domain-containing protein n=1 Tax=Flavobacterium hungaricum TaxID=2082725 RepID=A0ABR9TR43_9FLAO|nr:hypothetical protein [Flavobacterium hungaricum]MBE8727087.1 hypothetical protein [Flavobacterium hungaricum]
MRNIIVTFLILFINQVFCQNENDTNSEKLVTEIYGKLYKDLDPIEGTINILPLNKNIKFCSLYQCVSRIGYAEKHKIIEEKIIKRALEITTRLFNEGTAIYLTYGAESLGQAISDNEILTDDNNLIYVSVGQCIVSDSLIKISDAINKRTMELINKTN